MNETNKQMPLEIWTDINGHATRTQFNGGVRYIRAAEYDALREQNRVLREALQPFAKVAEAIDGSERTPMQSARTIFRIGPQIIASRQLCQPRG